MNLYDCIDYARIRYNKERVGRYDVVIEYIKNRNFNEIVNDEEADEIISQLVNDTEYYNI